MSTCETNVPFDFFIELSVYLTGFSRFELLATGMVQTYYDWVNTQAKTEFSVLLSAFAVAQPQSDIQKQSAIRSDDRTLTPLVRSVIKLWYLGQWYNPEDPSKTEILSPQSYQEGLVWGAIKAHPQGAKQQGFGAWALAPEALQEKRP